jgi:ORF6N domain
MRRLIPNEEVIISRIYTMRNQKIMFDFDLAEMYGVETRRLKEAVRRNMGRFPEDFMFELTQEEFQTLRSQFTTSKTGENRGGTRYLPFVFTEHGAVMLASVLTVKASIFVVRTFMKLRQLISGYKELTERMDTMEEKYDSQFEQVIQALEGLSEKKNEPWKYIGFKE